MLLKFSQGSLIFFKIKYSLCYFGKTYIHNGERIFKIGLVVIEPIQYKQTNKKILPLYNISLDLDYLSVCQRLKLINCLNFAYFLPNNLSRTKIRKTDTTVNDVCPHASARVRVAHSAKRHFFPTAPTPLPPRPVRLAPLPVFITETVFIAEIAMTLHFKSVISSKIFI